MGEITELLHAARGGNACALDQVFAKVYPTLRTLASARLRRAGAEATLTPTEFGILAALARVPGRVYSRYELINRVRGYEFEGYERTIDSHVKNLRRKVEHDPHRPEVVLTVLSGGYRLGLSRDP